MGGNTTARPWDEFFILEEDLMIELKHVTKTFTSSTQQVHACKDVNLTIQDGDIFGIIGFSGAGKSTLVRCLNLLEHPTSGEVLFDGVDITKLNEKELRKVRKNWNDLPAFQSNAFKNGSPKYFLSIKRKQAFKKRNGSESG